MLKETVNIFFPQPPLRIDSFQTTGSLHEKNAKMSRVVKLLLISRLQILSTQKPFSTRSDRRPNYG